MKSYNIARALALLILCVCSPPVVRADLTNGLVGWWTFDEMTGESAADSAGVLYLPGTLQPTGAGPTVGQLGRVGASYLFDGVNDSVKFFTSAFNGLIPETNDFSAFLWFNMPRLISTVNAQGMLLSCNNGQTNRANNGIQNVNGTNRVYWFHNGGLSPSVYYGDPVIPNEWYLLGISRSNNVFYGWLNTNGYVLGTSTAPISVAADWVVGRQISGSSFFSGRVDDLRVYNRPLTQSEVLEMYTQPSGLGTPQSLAISLVRTQMVAGNFQQARVFADYANFPGLELKADSGMVLTSSDTNVVSVSADGLVTAIKAGQATLSVSLSNQTAGVAVTVVPMMKQLVHRYSFTANAQDAIGTNHGTLYGNASVAGGALVLASDTLDYVDLGPNMITGEDQFTFEAWASFGTNATWARVYDFGNNDNINGISFVYLTPNNDTASKRVAINGESAGVRVGLGDNLHVAGTLDNTTNVHIVAVYRPLAGYLQLFINGSLVGQLTNVTTDPTNVINNYSYLGKSQFAVNPYMNMRLDEFRMYRGVLDQTNVAMNAVAGPDRIVTDPGALTSVSLAVASSVPQLASARVDFRGNFANIAGVNLAGFPGLTFTSSDTNVATVDAAGLVKAVAAGSATITGSYAGKSATASLTVVPSTVPNNGLVGWWPFEEPSGETVFDSAGLLNLNGSLLPAGAGPLVAQPGRIGSAYSFDGSNDYLSFPGTSGGTLIPATGDFSCFVWVNLSRLITAASAQYNLLNCNNGQANRAVNGIQNVTGTNRFFWFHNGGLAATYYGDPLTTNEWYLQGLTRSNDVFIGWFNTNGYVLGSSSAPISTAVNWAFGRQISGSSYLAGRADDLRVYNRALAPADVMQIYSQPRFPLGVSITVHQVGGQIVLLWAEGGTLQQADQAAGPFTDVVSATSPHVLNAAEARKFFRVRRQ